MWVDFVWFEQRRFHCNWDRDSQIHSFHRTQSFCLPALVLWYTVPIHYEEYLIFLFWRVQVVPNENNNIQIDVFDVYIIDHFSRFLSTEQMSCVHPFPIVSVFVHAFLPFVLIIDIIINLKIYYILCYSFNAIRRHDISGSIIDWITCTCCSRYKRNSVSSIKCIHNHSATWNSLGISCRH